jgi:hypothetical protein
MVESASVARLRGGSDGVDGFGLLPGPSNLPLSCYRSKYLNNVQPQPEASSRVYFIISGWGLRDHGSHFRRET